MKEALRLARRTVLFVTRYPVNQLEQSKVGSSAPDKVVDLSPLGVVASTGSIGFVPPGFPGAGSMKIVSVTDGGWYHADFVPDGSNTFDITAASLRANIVGGPDGIAFVPPGSPVFPSNSVLIALYGLGKVVTAPLDANGDPILANAQDVLQQLGHADGACIDPVTGDFLFGSFSAQGQLIRVSGFEAPTPTPTATVTPTPAATATATPSGTAKAKTNERSVAVSALASLTLNPATVTGGANNSTGTVTLSAAAPAGGAVVALTSNNPNAATVPTSVTVAAGATTATFTVATRTVTVGTVATITATYDGISQAGGLVVNPLLGSLTLNPSVLIGGANNSTGTVTLSAAAPAGGAVVALTSSNTNAATVPASVTVAAGATTKTFVVTTSAVAVPTQANITATCVGASTISTLTLNPPLVGFTVTPATATGPVGSTGRVTLGSAAPAGGAVVALTSSNGAATVPDSVTVPAGAIIATFQVNTTVVTVPTAVILTATYSGVARTATLTVNPPVALVGVSVNPTAVTGLANSTGRVTLSAAAPAGGAVVALTSSNTNAATVPASVTVAAGATTKTFVVHTSVVAVPTAVILTATYSGVARTATLTVNPPVALVGVSVNPTAVTGPANSTGRVTLSAAAPAGGAVVALTSSNTNAATVPASVTVAAGATTKTFVVHTSVVAVPTAVILTATYSGVARTATLTVNPAGPAALAGVAMNPATMIFGGVSTGTVTLTAPAPAGGAVIALSSSDGGVCFYLLASVTVPAGGTTAQFTVTSVVAPSTTFITANYNGVNKTSELLTSERATVTALTCTPNPVIGGDTTVCTVTMNGIMVEDTPVSVLSDQPLLLPGASGWLTVPAGAVSAAFSLPTPLVPDRIVAHISANAPATATVTAPLTINLTNRGRKWNLNNVVFKDRGTANGYFVYDQATGQYLAVNIRVTHAIPDDPNNPLGHAPEDLYYYPWPNGLNPTIVDNWSRDSLMSLQNPVTSGLGIPPSWTLLQFNFAQPLTNAGGIIPLVIDPNVPYTPYCAHNPSQTCTPPPENISQELFALPDNPFGVPPAWYYRVIVSGTVTTAQ